MLIRAARSFDESPHEDTPTQLRGASPGDDYNACGPDWSEILTPHGWVCARTSGEKRYWARPGKKVGWSATTGFCTSKSGRSLFAVFTTDGHPFPGPNGSKPCSTHDKFGAYCLLNHAGDFGAAARVLKQAGWGERGTHNDNGTPKPETKKGIRPKIFTLPALLAMDLPPPKWVVPGIICEGLTIFAGKPKLGKSFLALNLALTIAAGGKAIGSIPVKSGDVLYLCLEDRLRRVQDRSRKLLTGLDCGVSNRLHLSTEWPRQDKDGLVFIREWMDSVPAPTLVIIDVWVRFRTPIGNSRSQYDHDYETAAEVKAMADKYGAAIMPVHHCKKAAAEDVLEEISGTFGLAGCADGALILTRARGECEANLFVVGRDVEEDDLALEFDPKTCCWFSHGKAKERTESLLKQNLIALFKSNAGAVLPKSEIAATLKIGEDKLQMMATYLTRMVNEGLIERVRQGQFRWPINGTADTETFQ